MTEITDVWVDECAEPEVKKPSMISLKDQLRLSRNRLLTKIMKRRMKHGVKQKNPGFIPFGNKDYGVPYTGKDRYSGQFRKFAERIEYAEEGNVHRLHYADNNKYNGNGTLKD